MTVQSKFGTAAKVRLLERVRSTLGRCVSHPEAIDVDAFEGRVTLSGAVLQGEHPRLVRRIRAVEGVVEVQDDHLAVYATAEGVTALQGGRARKSPWALGLILMGAAAAAWLLRTVKK